MRRSFSPRRSSDLTLEFIILWIVSEIAIPDLESIIEKNTNSKQQITNKSQVSIYNDQNPSGQDMSGASNFRHWDLIFGISTGQ